MGELLGTVVFILVVMPVDDRVIEPYAQALFVQGADDLFHQVAMQHRAGGVGADLGIMQGKTFVMFGGENDVTAAGGFGERGPVFGEIWFRFEEGDGGLGVGVGVGLYIIFEPFHAAGGADGFALPGAGETGVKAPVNEHAESGIAPPAHAGVMLGGGFHGVLGADGGGEGDDGGGKGQQDGSGAGVDIHGG